jgi:hypothetical protein
MERHRTLKVAGMADGQVSTKVACSEYAIRLKSTAARVLSAPVVDAEVYTAGFHMAPLPGLCAPRVMASRAAGRAGTSARVSRG